MSASSAIRSLAKRLGSVLRHGYAARGGAAAVEFAVMSPFLLALLVPIADLGAYIYDYMQLQLAVQAGAEYAARNSWNPTGIQNAIIAGAPSLNLSNTNDPNVPNNDDILPSPFDAPHVQWCGCASGTTVTQVPGPGVACPNPRPICQGTNLTSGLYYTLGAQWRYHTISGFKYPLFSNSQLITASATFRKD